MVMSTCIVSIHTLPTVEQRCARYQLLVDVSTTGESTIPQWSIQTDDYCLYPVGRCVEFTTSAVWSPYIIYVSRVRHLDEMVSPQTAGIINVSSTVMRSYRGTRIAGSRLGSGTAMSKTSCESLGAAGLTAIHSAIGHQDLTILAENYRTLDTICDVPIAQMSN